MALRKITFHGDTWDAAGEGGYDLVMKALPKNTDPYQCLAAAILADHIDAVRNPDRWSYVFRDASREKTLDFERSADAAGVVRYWCDVAGIDYRLFARKRGEL